MRDHLGNDLAAVVAQAVVRHSAEGILVVDRAGTVHYANAAAESLFGYPPGHLPGRNVGDLVPPELNEGHRRHVSTFERRGAHVMGHERQLRAVRSDGSEFPAEIILTRLEVSESDLICATVRDVTERVELHQRLVHQSLHDPLTGLGNRAMLNDRISHALARLERRQGYLGLLVCDVDHFKEVNDSFGHVAGDELLVELGARMTAVVRPEDTVVRHGGDEFVVLCESMPGPDDAVALAQRLIEAVREPVVIDGTPVKTSFSIGGYVCTDCADADDLLRFADRALYEAKDAGRDRAVVRGPDEA